MLEVFVNDIKTPKKIGIAREFDNDMNILLQYILLSAIKLCCIYK